MSSLLLHVLPSHLLLITPVLSGEQYKISKVFWNVTPYSLVYWYQCLDEPAASIFTLLCTIYRWQVPLKWWYTCAQITWHHVPEDLTLDTRCHENLKPHTVQIWNTS
jgi:hypothetical protein